MGILAKVTAQYFFYKVYFMYLLYILCIGSIVTGTMLKRCFNVRDRFPTYWKHKLDDHDVGQKNGLEKQKQKKVSSTFFFITEECKRSGIMVQFFLLKAV